MKSILALLLLAVAFGQDNTPFDTQTGNPFLEGTTAPASPSGAIPQSPDMFARPNFGGPLGFDSFGTAEGSASLPSAPLATGINSSDPMQIATYLQQNIARDLRSDYTQFVDSSTITNCCANFNPTEIFREDFESTTVLNDVDYKQFRGRGAPNPGNYKIASSAYPGLSPWTYHSCRNRHLWVNGINTNWNPFYRRIFSVIRNVDRGTYRVCFNVRNLPQATWDAKPFGYVVLNQGTTSAITFWNANLPTTTSCRWRSVISSKFSALSGLLNLTISLYNGDTQDGNDLVLDDIRLIRLRPPTQQPSFNYELINFTGNTFSLRLGSKQIPPQCRDNFYLRAIPYLFTLQAANVTIRSSNEYTYTGLSTRTNYEIGVKRVCDCSEDSFWRLSFNLNFGVSPGFAQAVPDFSGSLALTSTATQTQGSALSSGLTVQSESNEAFEG